ncbi:MAG: hypothetical protein JF625_00830, partial [Inquilinus limosus]|nr:hypothetical protein [Inquilinus limosus]
FPITDAGGQWAWVRTAPAAEPVRLHRFWDSAGLTGDLALSASGTLETQLARDPPPAEDSLAPDPETAFARWIAHSRELAYGVVYQGGRLRMRPSPRSAAVLPPGYVEQARTVSRTQLRAAGHRIGALLTGLR